MADRRLHFTYRVRHELQKSRWTITRLNADGYLVREPTLQQALAALTDVIADDYHGDGLPIDLELVITCGADVQG